MRRFLAALMLMGPGLALAQPSGITGELAGEWKGELAVGGANLPLVLSIGEATTLQSPAQSPARVPGKATYEGGRLRVEFADMGAAFEGALEPGGKVIRGDFIQRGLRFPLALSRDGSAKATPNRPQTPKPPFPYRAEEAAYDNPAEPGVRLAGTLTLPQGPGPFPAALLITGSGLQDRDETLMGHKPFLVIADHLTRRGIAVLRVDDRSVGGSTGDVAKATTATFATDVAAGLAFLRTRRDIDPARIGLIGHSEGGVIAPMVAAKDPKVAFIVLLAGPGVRGDTLIIRQAQLVGRTADASPETLAGADALQRGLMSLAAGDATDEAVRTQATAQLTAGGMPAAQAAAQAAQLASPWFRYFLRHDPAQDLARVKAPVLALLGARDLQVDAKQNAPALRAALARNREAAVEVVPGANHLFQQAATGAPSEYSTIETTISPAVLDRITGWVAAQVR